MDETTKRALRRLGISQYMWVRMTDEEKCTYLMDRVNRDDNKRVMRDAMPEEPERRPQDTEEPVLWFQKTFSNEDGRVYTYVAVKGASGKWQVIERGRVREFTWPQLFEFAMLRDGMPTFYRANGWEIVQ
jgi:hypothetical protein